MMPITPSVDKPRTSRLQDPHFLSFNIVVIGIFISFACLHYTAWSSYPPDVDPINFTVALQTYNISIDAPHPPGYPLYVFLGRLASVLVGSHHAYQLVDLLMFIGAGTCIYSLLSYLGYPAIGLSASVLFLSHPLAWSATTVPESYISDALLSCGLLLWICKQVIHPKKLYLGLICFYFFFGLIRPVSCFLLIPLVFGTVCLIAPNRKHILALGAIVSGLGGVLAAYALTVFLAGGLETYRSAVARVMGQAFKDSSFLAGAPLAAHIAMITKLTIWLFVLAAPAILLVMIGLLMQGQALLLQWNSVKVSIKVGLLWIVPPFAFYGFVYYLKPTYHLIYLPSFLIVVAWMIHRGFPNFKALARWVIIGILVISQLGFFLAAPTSLPSQISNLTHRYTQQQDTAWKKLLGDLSQVPLVVQRSLERVAITEVLI